MKIQSNKTLSSLPGNPHCWAIAVMFIGITLLYYSRDLNIGNGFPWFDSIRIMEIAYSIHGSLYTIPFVYTAIVFGWQVSAMLWLLSLAVIFPRVTHLSYGSAPLVRNIFFSLIPLLLAIFVGLNLTWRERERNNLRDRENERRLYMGQIIKVQEDERLRIAKELHDDLLQSLIVIANRARKFIHYQGTAGPDCDQAKFIENEALRLSDELRRLCLDLRPGILDNRGLLPALRWLAERFDEEYKINIVVNADNLQSYLTPEIEVMLFRIVQEAFNNIRRHAGATEIRINLESFSGGLRLTVQDNGKGFQVPKSISHFTVQGKLGLAGIQERAKYLNGDIEISSEVGKGTTLSVVIRGGHVNVT